MNRTKTEDRQVRDLTANEIDAVNGGIIVGVAVGAFVAYMGLHAAVEHYLLETETAWYAAR